MYSETYNLEHFSWSKKNTHVIFVTITFSKGTSLSRRWGQCISVPNDIWNSIMGQFLYLIVPFWSLQWHIRQVWLSHGLYFSGMQLSQNTHGKTKWAWYIANAYQKCTLGIYQNLVISCDIRSVTWYRRIS